MRSLAELMPHAPAHDRTAANKLVRHLLATPGRTVSVFDGGDWTVKRSRRVAAILGALATTSDDLLRWHDADGAVIGAFWLIYGNGPGETVADYTANAVCEAAWQAAQP